MTTNTREFIAVELKSLVGWGATAKRLAHLPGLRRLAGVSDDVDGVEAGFIVRRFIVGAIDSLTGSYDFRGTRIEADQMKRAYRLLLWFDGHRWDSPERRRRAIETLGVWGTASQWRRPFSPEMDLFLILAEVMCQTSTNSPTD